MSLTVSCRLSATGVRFSVIRFPPRDWALLTVGLPTHRRVGPRRGYRVPHARATTGLGAFYTPRTTELIPDRTASSAGVCRSTAASPCHPAPPSIARGSASRGINEGSSNSPVRSSPRPPPPGWNEQQLRLSPELRTPPARSQTTHVGAGTGQLSTDLRQRSTTSTEPPMLRVYSIRATSRRTAESRAHGLGYGMTRLLVQIVSTPSDRGS